ncbi:MAG TPA: argininosuccinate lyase [Candidatus Monoglobus merdigallinarum]|uniref:Argininosuccinate lyase n=1 Tax=Candidatus Monoglobus merdigallinarum TaxID=2838698 RepID=A0A9D1PRA9_9FIRM|nr:argininosuccinate lyase [Candidatus Monoglobus merdigallinarum]
MAKLWGGRFSKATDALVDDFNSSIRFDSRMYAQDIAGSKAHAEMLGRQGIIKEADAELIVKTLSGIQSDIESGKIEFTIDAEDIHMNIETILISRIGDVGKRLHTGRSRNDQVALDTRMYLRDESDNIVSELEELKSVILSLAEEHLETAMPGYTHLQKAQPITLAHHLMAYYEMFKRDTERLADCRKRMNIMPLGSGALAATTYPLDREFVAEKLGFDGVTQNSLDGVSDRDFVLELAFCLSVVMTHLSRFSEEIILWSTGEFGFIVLDDAYSTGSSIMPQKKNPDVAELARGKTGRVYGDLMGLLTVMKSLPLAYNKDMQEDKEQIFDALDTVKMCIPVFAKMIATMTVKKDAMLRGAKGGFTNATDVADYLVNHGLPFRDAHSVVGHMVAYCIEHDTVIDALSMEEFLSFSELFEEDIYDAISVDACIGRRSIVGGPAAQTVKKLIEKYKK